MSSCASCGGFIGEPGKAYGFAGRWCCCTEPIPNDYPQVQGFLEIKEGIMPSKTLDDLIKSQPLPIVVVPPPETLTPTEFVHWLRGYAAHGHLDPKVLAELQKVKT